MQTKTSQTTIDKLAVVEGSELLAMSEKYEGASYREITEKIEETYGEAPKEATLRMWFYKNGRLHDVYEDYKAQMAELEEEAARDFIASNVMVAVKTLVRVMQDGGAMAQVAAAKVMLERGLGKVASVQANAVSGEKFTLKDFVEKINSEFTYE